MEPEIVWLTEERTFGILLSLGASFSWIKYSRDGIDYEILVENDEFEYREAGPDDGVEG